ncbi:MAG: alpha-N-acetylglucosaminidase TIM-barrel domain-containing protein [bacterium]|nr:alpha-N-acetylglucosaminidase TIM-barrel domain-containing protein [bacterium]
MQNKTHLSLLVIAGLATTVWATNTASLDALIHRVAPALENRVTFDVDASAKAITITPTTKNNFTIKAPNQRMAAAGVGCYLRYVAKAHWSWCGSRLDVPMPTPTKTLTYTPTFDRHIAYNFCTLSYTMAYWDEAQWTEELDRLALYGFDMPLVQMGLPKVWQLTLKEIGYPEEKIKAFLPDEASAAWWNMGNLEGLGGPLSQAEVERNAELGHWLVQEMKARDMRPILLGFTGLVPHDLGQYLDTRVYGDVKIVNQGKWVDGFVRPAVLAPSCEAFDKIAAIYYKHLKAVYGVEQIDAFAGDLFHEGGNAGGLNVTECARAVQAAQQKASPGAIWIVQAWHGNPTKALLAGLDPKLSIVEALVGDMQYGNAYNRSFDGIPWVWCELLNFGGNHGLYGGFNMLTQMGALTKQKSYKDMVGYGLLSEGLETNPLFYELFTERFFMPATKNFTADETSAWISDYAMRRYGSASKEIVEGLTLLTKSVYNPTRKQEGTLESIYCARPSWNASKASSWASGEVYYNAADTLKAAQCFHAAATAHPELLDEETFRYDYVDIARQAISDCGRPLLAEANAKPEARQEFLKMILATELILEGSDHFRMDIRERNVQLYGKNRAIIALRRMYTTWTGRSGKLNDYAHRQQAGLMRYYYYYRWKNFFDAAAKNQNVSNQTRDALDAKYLRQTIAMVQPVDAGSLLKRVGASLDFVEKIHKKYPARFIPEVGKPWTLPNVAPPAVMTFSVSEDIQSAGVYEVEIKWKAGRHALKISKVELYEGNKLVASDEHPGSTGWKHDNNVYTLEVKQYRTGLEDYELRITCMGDNGRNSSGVFIIRPKQ